MGIVKTFFEVVGVVCIGLFLVCGFIIWTCERNDKNDKYNDE